MPLPPPRKRRRQHIIYSSTFLVKKAMSNYRSCMQITCTLQTSRVPTPRMKHHITINYSTLPFVSQSDMLDTCTCNRFLIQQLALLVVQFAHRITAHATYCTFCRLGGFPGNQKPPLATRLGGGGCLGGREVCSEALYHHVWSKVSDFKRLACITLNKNKLI